MARSEKTNIAACMQVPPMLARQPTMRLAVAFASPTASKKLELAEIIIPVDTNSTPAQRPAVSRSPRHEAMIAVQAVVEL